MPQPHEKGEPIPAAVAGRETPETIPALVEQLASEDFTTRVSARQNLVQLGSAAALPLAEALRDPRVRVRQEAARALVDIADRRTAAELARALSDDDVAVRWAAADALIALGRFGLEPVLAALAHHAHCMALRETASHVLNRLQFDVYREILAPVRQDLADLTIDEAVHVSAFDALKVLAASRAAKIHRA